MFGQIDRPRDLVIFTFLVAGAFVVSYTLYGMAGQKFTQWFVKDGIPKIQAQTEDEFPLNGVVNTNFNTNFNFNSSSFSSGFGSSSAFSGSE